MDNHQLYIISGLGADHRVFQYMNFSGYEVTHIQWITPLKKESIEDYAKRLSAQIKTPNPTLIGMSFGGMMAIEIGKQLKTEKIILIASVKTKNEIPFYLKTVGQLHHIIPTVILKTSTPISRWFFGIREGRDRKLFSTICRETDPVFFNWAVDKIVNWKNTVIPPKVKHIQGSSDRIFPVNYVKADVVIPNGGHFMTVDKAELLTSAVRNLL